MSRRNKKGRLISGLIHLTYWLPRFVVKSIGVFIGLLGQLLNARNARVVARNLELCYPDYPLEKRQKIARKLISHNALLSKEVATAWVGSEAAIRNYISGVTGEEIVKNASANNQPLVICVPHIGNWEFFWHWLQMNYPAISMYSPAQYESLDKMMLDARQRFGGRPFATDNKGIMGLLRALKKGGMMMILPDQVPKNDGGVFAPFFGIEVFTMTLVHKFVEKTGAQLCFGTCIRQSDSKYQVELEKADFDSGNLDAEEFCRLMNQQLEKIITRNPEQYQWNYKRFKRLPDGSDIYRN